MKKERQDEGEREREGGSHVEDNASPVLPVPTGVTREKTFPENGRKDEEKTEP